MTLVEKVLMDHFRFSSRSHLQPAESRNMWAVLWMMVPVTWIMDPQQVEALVTHLPLAVQLARGIVSCHCSMVVSVSVETLTALHPSMPRWKTPSVPRSVSHAAAHHTRAVVSGTKPFTSFLAVQPQMVALPTTLTLATTTVTLVT